jgi:hypothetical protein
MFDNNAFIRVQSVSNAWLFFINHQVEHNACCCMFFS